MSTTKTDLPTARATAEIRHALSRSGFIPLRFIDVQPTQDGVRLTGTVSTYYLKQMALALAMSVSAIVHVDNHLEVK